MTGGTDKEISVNVECSQIAPISWAREKGEMNILTYRSHYARREPNGMSLKSLRQMKEFVKKLCAFCFNDGDVFSDSRRTGHRGELLSEKFAIDSPFRMIMFHSKQQQLSASSIGVPRGRSGWEKVLTRHFHRDPGTCPVVGRDDLNTLPLASPQVR